MTVVIIGCGVGSSTALFSIIDAAFLHPLPFPSAERLIAVYSTVPDQRSNPASAATWDRGQVSWDGWQQLRDSPVFDVVGAWSRSRAILGHPGEDFVDLAYVSSSLPSMLGASPRLGRGFSLEEDSDLSSDAILLSHECWQRRYGGSDDVIGRQVTVAIFVGEPLVKTIVGVLPPTFRLRGFSPDLILPMGQRIAAASQRGPAVYLVARLAPGTSLASATAVAETVVPATLVATDRVTARVVSLREDLTGQSTPSMWLLVSACVAVLLMACASAGGLLLSQTYGRQNEFAVREAIGASRGQIMRQLVLEYGLGAVFGLVAGLLGALWLIQAVTALLPMDLRSWMAPRVSGVALCGAAILAAVVNLGFGLCPAFQLVRRAPQRGLSSASNQFTVNTHFAHRGVVVVQLSVSFCILVVATLLAGTLWRLSARPLGFVPSGLAVVSVKVTSFPKAAVALTSDQLPLFRSWRHTEGLLERLEGITGVVGAAGVSGAPFLGSWRNTRVKVGSSLEDRDIQVQVVTEAYFRTMGIRLLSGRGFSEVDRQRGIEDRHLKVIVSDELERRLLDGKAVGRRLRREVSGGEAPLVYEVIGVVSNVRQRHFADDNPMTLYMLNPTYSSINDIIVRTAGEPSALLPAIRQAIADYDPATLLTSSADLNAIVTRSLAGERYRAAVSIWLGTSALILAAFGVFALSMRSVVQRRREIAIRAALGATPAHVVRLMLVEALGLLAVSLVCGGLAGAAMGYGLRAFLFGVSPWSPEGIGSAALVLVLATLIAMVIPARRAASTDVGIILRE